MADRPNPLKLNPLQAKTLALLQELARQPRYANPPDADGAVVVRYLPAAHGDHFHIGDAVVRTLARYAPGIESLILHRQVITPDDIERITGLSEGNIFQGELALQQLFFLRPVPEWARYRTPIHGYWQCGAGTHPGGGIMGASGRLAALEMLKAGRFATLATFGTSYSIKLPTVGAQVFVPIWHRALGREAAAGVTAHFTSTESDARRMISLMLRDMRVDVVTTLAANLTWFDLIEAGTSATLPILLIYCGRDRLVNFALWETLRKMRGKPNFHRVDLPTAGHCANLEVPDEVRAALVEFWAGTPGGLSPGATRHALPRGARGR